MARLGNVELSSSRMILSIVKIMKDEGYIRSYVTKVHNNVHYILIELKYAKDKRPVIHGLKRISKPGRRVYSECEKLPSILNNHGALVVSTSKGVITGREAKKLQVGGELICSIW